MALKPVSCRIHTDALTCNAVIASMTGEDVTFTINGNSYTVSMSVIGNDRSVADDAGVTHAMYYGVQEVTGLTAFTGYTWAATQVGNTDTGYFTTLPNKKAVKCAVANTTCFSPNRDVSNPSRVTAWNFLKHYIKTSSYPVVNCNHVDDIYYANGFFNALAAGTGNDQGKIFEDATNANGLRGEYDFALSYGQWFNVVDEFYINYSLDPSLWSRVDSEATQEPFNFCMNNTAVTVGSGDHEYQNNLGWKDGSLLTDVPNGYHTTVGGYDGTGLTVYNTLMGPLEGKDPSTKITKRDANAKHWYLDVGPMRYITMDAITNSVYNVDPALMVCYGTNQIDDVLEIANTDDQWFTCINNAAVAGRGFPSFTGLGLTGTNYKDENFSSVEYDRLWLNTGQTPPSLMGGLNTNGVMGSCVMQRGDWHNGGNYLWRAAAVFGKYAESFMEIGLATVNTSAGADNSYDLFTSTMENTDEVTLLGNIKALYNVGNDTIETKPDNFNIVMHEIDGTKSTPEVVIKRWNIAYNAVTDIDQRAWFTDQSGEEQTDEDGNVWKVVVAKRLVRHAGNAGYDVDDPDVFQLLDLSFTDGTE